jgi:DoxX-like family
MISRGRWRSVLVVALRFVITFLFAPAILAKLRHPVEWGHLFTTWGYPAWGAVAISYAEIIGLMALWIPRLARAGIAILMITLSGAAVTWLTYGPRGTAAYPGTILILVGLLAWLTLTASAGHPLQRNERR